MADADDVFRQWLRGNWYRVDVNTREVTLIRHIPPVGAAGVKFVNETTVVYGTLDNWGETEPVPHRTRQITTWVVDLETGRTEQVVSGVGYNPILSPDGQRLAFLAASAPASIGVVPTSGGSEPRVLHEFPADAPHPTLVSWAPDGQALFFSAPVDGSDELPRQLGLWRVSTAGDSRPQMVVEFQQHRLRQSFSMSPDGSRVAFSAGENMYEVWTMDNFLPTVSHKTTHD